jgi:hypothetical protein
MRARDAWSALFRRTGPRAGGAALVRSLRITNALAFAPPFAAAGFVELRAP